VQHEQFRVVYECGGELDALLIAEGQLFDTVLQAADKSERGQDRLGGLGSASRFDTAQSSEVHELVEHPHLRVEPALLGHVAEPPPHIGVQLSTAPANHT